MFPSSRSKLGRNAITPGEPAAIYCRISHTKDEDQTGVDRQERICREVAERLQLRVEPAHVYVDNNRSAWQRNRKRPGWEEMLKAMGEGEIRHVIVYHPDRLMRQPRDLEELLSIADDKRILRRSAEMQSLGLSGTPGRIRARRGDQGTDQAGHLRLRARHDHASRGRCSRG
ncbi:recombinase family protein [Streptomyces sp. NPDC003710]